MLGLEEFAGAFADDDAGRHGLPVVSRGMIEPSLSITESSPWRTKATSAPLAHSLGSIAGSPPRLSSLIAPAASRKNSAQPRELAAALSLRQSPVPASG